jgi:formate hydrogenlyase subunit 6/NADH:ubiquinone oxidoreductase subunit I
MFKLITTTMRNLFSRPATRRYPLDRRSAFAGSRGRLEIELDKCIFCTLCAKRCPADAIVVDRAARKWELDPYKCIVCAYCLEACPKKCLYMGPDSTAQTGPDSTAQSPAK